MQEFQFPISLYNYIYSCILIPLYMHACMYVIGLEPIMLKNLPIIPSQTSQKFIPIVLNLFPNHHLLFLLILLGQCPKCI